MLGFIAGRLRRSSTLLTVLRPGPATATKRSIHHQLVDRQTKNAPSAAAGCIWATTVAGSCSKAGPAAPKLPLLPGNTPTLRSPSAAPGCSWGLATAASATGGKSTAVCSRGLATGGKSTALAAVCNRGLATAAAATGAKSTVLAAVRAKIVGVAVALLRVMVGPQRAHIALARLARIYWGDGSTMPRVATAADMSVVEVAWRRLHLLLRPRVLTVKARKAVKEGAGDLGMQVLVCTFVAVRFEGATPAEAIYKNLSYLEVFFKTSLLAVGDAVKLWVQQQPSHVCDVC
uniref:Uncharacterized protein n=1 Tax=Oryza barthii TaxID=65489 RepID=A0A0D3GMA9_9ORYZ